MAYTKIKPVKHHLQRCLDYTSNPKKTEKFSADDLNRLLSYTQNQNKTEHQLYVTGFRCNPATAYRRMYRTKKRWNQPMDSQGHYGRPKKRPTPPSIRRQLADAREESFGY